MTITLGKGKQAKQYTVEQLETDFGTAYRFTKESGESYEVCIDGVRTYCDCLGHEHHGHCKHIEWVKENIT